MLGLLGLVLGRKIRTKIRPRYRTAGLQDKPSYPVSFSNVSAYPQFLFIRVAQERGIVCGMGWL